MQVNRAARSAQKVVFTPLLSVFPHSHYRYTVIIAEIGERSLGEGGENGGGAGI